MSICNFKSSIVPIILMLTCSGWAEVIDVSPFLQSEIETNGIPGVIAQKYVDGELAASGAAGLRVATQPDNPIQAGDVMHWGSMFKVQTATLCGILINEGVLPGFDAKLVDYVSPEQKVALLAQDSRYGDVTLRLMLSMRSGIDDNRSFTMEGFLDTYNYNNSPMAGRNYIADQLTETPLAFDPGNTYSYSNIGYALAGLMVENAWNGAYPDDRKSYEELMHEKLFEPLGITTAHIGPPGIDLTTPVDVPAPDPSPVVIGHNMLDNYPAEGYAENAPVGLGYLDAGNPLCIVPAGAWAMSIEDIAQLEFVQMQTEQTELLDRLGLTIEILDEIRNPASGIEINDGVFFTLGWVIIIDNETGKKLLYYHGSNDRFCSRVYIDLETGEMELIAINTAAAGSDTILANVYAHLHALSEPASCVSRELWEQ